MMSIHDYSAAMQCLHLALCRSSELSTTENVAVRRLVQGAFQRVVATGGQSLGEVVIACSDFSDICIASANWAA